MKLFKWLKPMLFLLAASAQADERSEWFAERRAWIEHAKSAQTPESILELARIVTGVGQNLDQASPEAKDLFYEAKNQLLAIPGLQEHYRDRINEERAKYDEILKTGNVTQITDQRLRWADAKSSFVVMKYLPCVETVKVLGEFLADERGRMIVPSNASYEEKVEVVDNLPASDYAMFTFDGMPIVAKPYKRPGSTIPEREMPAALDAWRVWYEQVKAGNRTFRFEGDPTEWDLNGPAPKDKLVRIGRDRKRDAERSAGLRKSATSPEGESVIAQIRKSSPILGLLATFCLCATAVLYFLRGRRMAGT